MARLSDLSVCPCVPPLGGGLDWSHSPKSPRAFRLGRAGEGIARPAAGRWPDTGGRSGEIGKDPRQREEPDFSEEAGAERDTRAPVRGADRMAGGCQNWKSASRVRAERKPGWPLVQAIAVSPAISPVDLHEGSYPVWAETPLTRLRAQPRAWSAPKSWRAKLRSAAYQATCPEDQRHQYVSNFANRHRSKLLNRLPNIPIEATVGNIRFATEPQTSNERSLNDFLTFSFIW